MPEQRRGHGAAATEGARGDADKGMKKAPETGAFSYCAVSVKGRLL